MNFRRFIAASVAVIAAGVVAHSAGLWESLPQVTGSSVCVSNVLSGVPGTATYCAGSNVPAGPPNLTGAEIIVADTQLANSAPPQSVTIPLPLMGAVGNVAFNTTQTTYTVPNGVGLVVSLQTTALSTTITMPANPWQNQIVRFSHGGGTGSGTWTTTFSANTNQTMTGLAATSIPINVAGGSDTSVVFVFNVTTAGTNPPTGNWVRI